MNINFNPSRADILDTKKWLELEEKTSGYSFISSWDQIQNSIDQSNFATFQSDKTNIGFITWNDSKIHRDINYFAIEPSQRSSGLGKFFFQEFEKSSRETGLKALKLSHTSEDSRRFWKKMAFEELPITSFEIPGKNHFKPLIDRLGTAKDELPQNRLELWNEKPYKVTNQAPKWTWDLEQVTTTPILQPIDREWRAKIFREGHVWRDCKLNHLETIEQIEFVPFLYIDSVDKLFIQSQQ